MLNNVEMYTQMGYTESQVRRAYEYSQKNRIDMFDALQQLQNRDYAEQEKKAQGNIPSYSYLKSIKSFNLNQYEIIYSRTGVKENSYARDQIRQPNTPVGLFNVSNCCYLNSLLQCYFLMGSFTRQILAAEQIGQLPDQSETKTKRITNQYLLLAALKEMFAKMKLSSRRYLDPTPVLKNLVNSVGEKIEYGDEKDLNQINMQVVERLSECLMYTRKYFSKGEGSPSKIKKRQNIKNLFYGEKVEYIEGMEGSTVSDFMGIILNPKHDNILFALDEQFNYDVEVDGKIMKRHTFIKTLPKFLFLNIRRIQYQRKDNQLLKNSEKIAFDFVIYMDQFLENNEEESKIKRPKIRELQNQKTIRKSQLNHLNFLEQKLQQCKAHAKYLMGWEDRFPNQKQVEDERTSLKKQIEQIQKNLQEVESRKEKFVLMYIFVHRGDAISGHYWGYGRNGTSWYRFDVNCVSIKENDILIDMEKSNGTAYALVYAKQQEIENFGYPYYKKSKLENNFIDGIEGEKDYQHYIQLSLRKKIISENEAMHNFIDKQQVKNTVENLIKQYKTKFNVVKSEVEKYYEAQVNKKVPLYSNFASYLECTEQNQFMKYNVFSTSVYAKTEMTCRELIEKQDLLRAIQKSFRKKIKGKMTLKHFALECEPTDGALYKQQAEYYLQGKKYLEFLKLLSNGMKDYPKIPELHSMLQEITDLLKTCLEGIYLKSVVRQLVAVILLDLAKKGVPIKLSWAQPCKQQNEILEEQLIALNYKELPKQAQLKATSISKMKIEMDWNLLSLKKGFEYQLMSSLKELVNMLSQGMEIYRKNLKEKKLIVLANKTEPIELI